MLIKLIRLYNLLSWYFTCSDKKEIEITNDLDELIDRLEGIRDEK